MSASQVAIRQRLAELRGPREQATASGDALLRRLVDSFLTRTPAALDRLAGAIEAGDAPAAAATAHRLRGSATNLGADQLAAPLARVEAAAREGDLAHAGSLLPAARAAYGPVEQALRELLAAWPDGAAAGPPEGQR